MTKQGLKRYLYILEFGKHGIYMGGGTPGWETLARVIPTLSVLPMHAGFAVYFIIICIVTVTLRKVLNDSDGLPMGFISFTLFQF